MRRMQKLSLVDGIASVTTGWMSDDSLRAVLERDLQMLRLSWFKQILPVRCEYWRRMMSAPLSMIHHPSAMTNASWGSRKANRRWPASAFMLLAVKVAKAFNAAVRT